MNDTTSTEEPTTKNAGVWRSLWRTHFYAGMIVGPFMIWMALSGLGILYSQPIQSLLHGGSNQVAIVNSRATLENQVSNAMHRFPKDSFAYITPGATATEATTVGLTEPNGETRIVWTNPYTGVVTGTMFSGKDLPGFLNRFHGSILPREWKMPVPNVAWLFDEGPAWNHVEIGEVLVEILAGWGLMLAVSGLYLWWPRRGSPVRWLPSKSRTGRRRWRDLHTFAGIFLAGFLTFSVTTGLPWAAFWGTSWQTVASHITPNKANFWSDSSPSSTSPRLGDMTRFGNPVAWAMQDDQPAPSGSPMPNMPGMNHGDKGSSVMSSAGLPARILSLDGVQSAMLQDGMLPNATIYPPTNAVEDGETTYGSYLVFNPWPSSVGQQGAMYFDEFTGKKLGESTAKEWGSLQFVTEFGVQTHMGTEFGLASRLFMTFGCLLVIWNFSTALMMWNRRRRGGLGIPRRPSAPRIAKPFGIALIALALLYPLWGASVLLLLVFDRLAIQRSDKLRRAFGMPPSSTSS